MSKITAGILYLSFCILMIGCAAQKQVSGTVNRDTSSIKSNKTDAENRALNHFIDGAVAEAKGDYSGAILEYQDALRLDPKAGVYYALAKNYLALKKLSLAMENARKSIRLDSSQVDYYNVLADIYLAGRQNDSAAVILTKTIRLDSSNINAYYRLARIYEDSKPLQAINIYNKITDIIGPDWNVLFHVSELYATLGNFDKAAESLEKLLTIDPSNAGIEKLLAEYYQRAKKYDKALHTINDVLQFSPDDLDARERKANIYLAQGKWEEGAKEYGQIMKNPKVPLDAKLRIGASYFTQAVKDSTLMPVAKKFFETMNADTVSWQVKMYLGAIAVAEHQDSLAIDYFKEASKLASWNVEVWVRLGGLYFDNKKYDDAAKVMKEAVKSFPEDFRVNLILGLSLAQANKNEESLPYLKKAVELDSTDINALSAYGYTLSQLNKNDEAVKYLKMALRASPKDVNLLGTLGLIYDGQKKWELCDSVYSTALEIDSTNALVNNNYAYSLSERGIRLDEAEKMATLAIDKEPKNASYLDTMGWIYYKKGDYEKAKEYITKALKFDGGKPDVLEHMGDVEFKIGDKTKAKEYWEKALSMNKNNKELQQKIDKGAI